MSNAQLEKLEHLLREHIPLVAAMQARIQHFDGESLTVQAPLAVNQNHYGTAFGGSIYTVSLLAGWGLASLLLDQSGMIVVEHAEAAYKAPIKQDLIAIAQPTNVADSATFAADFHATGRARLDITSCLHAAGQPAFILHARFAARQ